MKLILYYLLSQNFVLGVLASCSFNDSCNHESLYDGSNTSELFTQSTDEMNGRNAETNKQKLKLPNMDVPEEISTFSLSHRIKALRNVFDHLISIERELVWKPLMPSRLSRSNFLVKIFSNLLKIMPFADFLASVREGISNRASCLTCNIIANVYMSPLFSMDIIASATRVVCITFRLQTPRVCNGIVNSFWVGDLENNQQFADRYFTCCRTCLIMLEAIHNSHRLKCVELFLVTCVLSLHPAN